jgi:3-oxoacyl-[acyl-carrier protein] reductase
MGGKQAAMTEPGSWRALLFVGGSSEIAVAAMRRLDQPGVVLLAHCHQSGARLETLASQLQHARLVVIPADLATPVGIAALLEEVGLRLHEVGCEALDGIVLAAGPPLTMDPFPKKAWSAFAAHLDVQVRAPAMLLSQLLPPMARKRRGRVVFVVSSCTLGTAPAGMADYVTAKHAQLGLMRALAAEYAAKNLQINAISPSMVETPFLRDLPRIVVEMTAAKHPLQRNATAEEVAPMLCFLLSEDAGYIHGTNIPITGGQVS